MGVNNTCNDCNEDGKPLMILVGWLGCKIKYLKRYAELYKSLGYDVVTRIPNPSTVVMASLPSDRIKPPSFFFRSMDQLANDTLDEICSRQCSHMVMQFFSNAGSFLWEAISDKITAAPSTASSTLILGKLVGVIFDSGPVDFSSNDELIYNAIAFCSSGDRKQLDHYLISREIKYGFHEETKNRRHRAKEFWAKMKNHKILLPHFYICSKDDKLTPYDSLSDLIRHGEKMRGKGLVHSCVFDHSMHCQHLQEYPNEYKKCITMFLDFCQHQHKNVSTHEKLTARTSILSRL